MGTFETRMIFSPFLSVDRSCDEILKWSKEQLTQAGLCPIQTFDLHTARISLHNCPCPNHGTEECDCQMVVLLVYGDTGTPETLILHGNRETTRLSIANTFGSDTTKALTELIKNTLMTKKSIVNEISK